MKVTIMWDAINGVSFPSNAKNYFIQQPVAYQNYGFYAMFNEFDFPLPLFITPNGAVKVVLLSTDGRMEVCLTEIDLTFPQHNIHKILDTYLVLRNNQ